jgi:aldose 1-epimerase
VTGAADLTGTPVVRFGHGGWQGVVWPAVGGSVGSLWYNGQPVLLDDPARPHPVLRAGMFPMVPFANRIRSGRLRLQDGSTRQIGHQGLDHHGHPLHGTGWLRPWQVAQATAGCVVLDYVHAPDPFWPWPFQARLRYAIEPGAGGAAAFRASLSLTCAGPEPMPASIGLHPWFAARPDARLSLSATGRWDPDDQGLCVIRGRAGALEQAAVGTLDLDSCLTGWSGAARLDLPSGRFALEASGDRPLAAHVYTPQDAPRFCVEPQTARSGAFELDTGLDHGVTWLDASHPRLSVEMTLTPV